MTASTEELPVPRGYCWVPTLDLDTGEVIARPVFGRSGQQLSLHLAEGSPVTASTIAQLINKGVECVAVVRPPPADGEAYAERVRQYESRLSEIFGQAPDESCAPLLAALLADGPSEC